MGSGTNLPPCFLPSPSSSFGYCSGPPLRQPPHPRAQASTAIPPRPSIPDFLLIRVYQPGLITSPESLAKFCLAPCPLFSSPYSRSQLRPVCRHSHRPGPWTLPTSGSNASPLSLRSSCASVLTPSSGSRVYALGQRLGPKDSEPLPSLSLIYVISPPHAKHKLES